MLFRSAGAQEIIDYGLYGWAMSRFTGTWVGLKCMHETVESTAVVNGALDRLNIVIPGPEDFAMPPGGLNIRLGDTVLGMEARLHDYKRDAMLAFIRANRLNKVITSGGRNPKIGVITTGKSYLDVRQALGELGIDEVKCNEWGLRIDKIACPWPIGRQELIDFAPVRQRLVRTHRKTGRKSLYLSSHAGRIVGWPVPEAQMLLRELTEHATQREFVYAHKWRAGDLVVWDNRTTMHRARPFDDAKYPRDLRQIGRAHV